MIKLITPSLAICFVLLQVGKSSFLSFAALGVVLSLCIFFKNAYVTRSAFNRIIVTWFIFFLGYFYNTYLVGYSHPLFLSITPLAKIAMFGIASIILIVCILPIKPSKYYYTYRVALYTSLITLLTLNLFYWVSELNIVPYFNSEYFLLHNNSLIDNFASIDSLESHLRFSTQIRNDLFYGEPSFLALVIFTTSSTLILNIRNNASTLLFENKLITPDSLFNFFRVVLLSSFFLLVSLSALSGYIYLISLLYFSRKFIFKGLPKLFVFVIFSTSIILFIYTNQEYLLNRLNLVESISYAQRVLPIWDVPVINYFFGDRMNTGYAYQSGFHNGFLFILLLAGFSAFPYIYSIFKGFYEQTILQYRVLSVIVLAAIIFQNGAIFSLSKLFILLLYRLSITSSSDSVIYNYKS